MKRIFGIDLFLLTLPLCAAIALAGILAPDELAYWAGFLTKTVFTSLDWFFLGAITGFLILVLWLGFGSRGNIKLARNNEDPEFSLVSWLSMLFAAGMGVGLLFWGSAEPLTHYSTSPLGPPNGTEAAKNAVTLTIFSWGLHAWAIYCFSGLVLAYYSFRHNLPHLSGTPIRATLKGRWVEPVAWMSDLVAVLAVTIGVSASAGTGIMQLHEGLHVVGNIPQYTLGTALILLGALFLCYMTSAATGLSNGIKWLSNLNISVAVVLLAFILLTGPTAFLLRNFVTNFGGYLTQLPVMAFHLYPYDDASEWFQNWPLTNMMWWIAWAPFVGVFIARISRGRTVREFVFGVLFVPTVFSLLWFTVFGGTALHEELFGAGGLAQIVRENVTTGLFALFDRLPASNLLAWTAVFLIFIFLVTSLDSATFVLGMLTSKGNPEPPVKKRLAWGVIIGIFIAALLISGNVRVLRAVAIMGSIPFILILMLQAVALIISMTEDKDAANRDQVTGEPARND